MSDFIRKLGRHLPIYGAFPGSIMGQLTPPAGYLFLVDDRGQYMLDENGAYLVVPV